MRIHIKRDRKDRWERSYLILPSVSRINENQPIKYEWVDQNKMPKEIPELRSLKEQGNSLNKITIISYFGQDKKSGELKLPLPFEIFEFLAVGYSIKWIEDKKVGKRDAASGLHEVTWSTNDCEILVKMDTYYQLSSYLTEKKSFKRQDIYYDLEEK